LSLAFEIFNFDQHINKVEGEAGMDASN